MPYVNQAVREQLRSMRPPANAGELTYELTRMVLMHLEIHGDTFARFAEAIAALEATKLEIYRRLIAPYEDSKISENGDLPGFYREPGR
ncbi:MAG: DUF6899 family protein [Bacteroidota bacterium]